MNLPRWLLWGEGLALFLLLPLLLAQNGFHRPVMYTCLWLTTTYCIVMMMLSPGFTWRGLWQGTGWNKTQIKHAAQRFALATTIALLLLLVFAPDRLFDFPRRRPEMWLMVMLYYPLLSVVPQEFIYRSFFYQRYGTLLPRPWLMILANGFCFGFMHMVLQNWVAPLLSFIGGVIFSYGYQQHRSLKWASLEHAAYGCMMFTIGLGWYFFRGLANG